MSDRRTSDVTIWDEEQSNSLKVNEEGEINTKSKITDGVNEVGIRDNSLKVTANDAFRLASTGRLFSATASFNVGTTEKALALFRNPALSGKFVGVYKVLISVPVKGASVSFNFRAGYTLTNDGTQDIPILCRRLCPSPAASVVNIFRNPVVSSLGIIATKLSSGADSNSMIDDTDFSLIFDEDSEILATASATSPNTTVSITIIWGEEVKSVI